MLQLRPGIEGIHHQHGAAIAHGNRLAIDLVGDDHVEQAGIIDRDADGIVVQRRDLQLGSGGTEMGQHVTQQHAREVCGDWFQGALVVKLFCGSFSSTAAVRAKPLLLSAAWTLPDTTTGGVCGLGDTWAWVATARHKLPAQACQANRRRNGRRVRGIIVGHPDRRGS